MCFSFCLTGLLSPLYLNLSSYYYIFNQNYFLEVCQYVLNFRYPRRCKKVKSVAVPDAAVCPMDVWLNKSHNKCLLVKAQVKCLMLCNILYTINVKPFFLSLLFLVDTAVVPPQLLWILVFSWHWFSVILMGFCSFHTHEIFTLMFTEVQKEGKIYL